MSLFKILPIGRADSHAEVWPGPRTMFGQKFLRSPLSRVTQLFTGKLSIKTNLNLNVDLYKFGFG